MDYDPSSSPIPAAAATPLPDPWIPTERRTPQRPRYALHVGLLLLTFVTLAMTGGLFWEGGFAEIQSDVEFLHPETVRRNITAGLTYACWVLLILGAHEMGHYLACRYYRIPATLPFFLPGPPLLIGSFGAVIRIRGPIPHRRALFDVAAAGPIAGLVFTLPPMTLWLLGAEPVVAAAGEVGGWYLGEPLAVRLLQWAVRPEVEQFRANSLFGAGWVGLLVTALNLFPVGQLDGGHAAYAVSRRLHRVLSFLTPAALIVVIVFQLTLYRQFPAYLVWLGILLWMRDRHPRLIDESEALGAGRRGVAILLLLLFLLSFTALPFYAS